MNESTPVSIWAVSDGRAGMENQALGLAEAIARRTPAEITIKRIKIAQPFDRLPRWLWGNALNRLAQDSAPLSPPYPDVWIACGRRTVPLSIAIKGKGPLVVQTQAPRAALSHFDLVVPPRHDQLSGGNVIATTGSPNRLTEERLQHDATVLRNHLPPLPRPFVSVLLGGGSKDYHMTDSSVDGIIARLQKKIEEGYGVLITPSRRTSEKTLSRLREALPADKVWIWDGAPIGPLTNPYFGMLGVADSLLVTEESANMLTDAAFTGKPVIPLKLEGGAPKWQRFHDDLSAHGVFSGNAYAPLRETDRVAGEILSRLKKMRSSAS